MENIIKNIHVIDSKDGAILYSKEANKIFRCNKQVAREIEYYQNGKACNYEVIHELRNKFTSLEQINIGHSSWIKNGILDKLIINITNQCNLRCVYCFADYGKYSNHTENASNLSLKVIGDIFQLLKKYNVRIIKEITFFGGEPLLGGMAIREVCERFEFEKSKGNILQIPKYTLISNMTICSEEIIALIDRYNIGITASIDGPQHIHDLQRITENGDGSYSKVKQNYSRLKKHIQAIEVTYTMNHVRSSMGVVDVKKWLSKEFDVSEKNIDVVPVSQCQKLQVDTKKYQNLLNDSSFTTEDTYILSAIQPALQSDLFCNAGYNRLAIALNGDIYPCQMFVGKDYAKIGNVNTKAFDLEKLEKISLYRKNYKKCTSCWASKFCRVCPAQIFMNEENMFSDEKCNQRLQRYEMVIRQICDIKRSVYGK